MNFTGKYITRNNTVVIVEEVTATVDGQEWVKWRGTRVIETSSAMPRPTFYWDEKGCCLLCFGEVGDNSRFDLMRAVNPQAENGGLV